MQNRIIDQAVALEKLIKATERSLAKVVITDAQNEDLVQLAETKHRKKNKQAGNLGRARVIGGKIEGPRCYTRGVLESKLGYKSGVKQERFLCWF